MNKLFNKVAVALVGMAMAIGVGVAVGKGEVREAKAAYVEVDALDLSTKAISVSGYNATNAYTGSKWSIKYGANNSAGWEFFKMGGKKATLADYNPAEIFTTSSLGDRCDKIVVSGPSGSFSKTGMSVTSWGLYVYSDSALTSQYDYVAGTVSNITSSSWSQEFTPSSGKTWTSGKYFKVSWTLANTTTTNGIVCVDSIVCSKYIESATLTGISVSDTSVYYDYTATPVVSPVPATADLPTDLVYSLSNVSPSGCVSVNASTGLLTGSAPGSATLTVTSSGNNSITDTATITVISYPLSGIEVGKEYAIINSSSKYELSSIVKAGSTDIGQASSYSTDPTCDYPITVENGSKTGSVSLKLGTKYLAWSAGSGNSLTSVSNKTDESSWVVTYADSVYSVINLSTFHNDSNNKRFLKFNSNSGQERFACYTSGMENIEFHEIVNKSLEDFTIEEEVNVYIGGTHTIAVTYDPVDATDKNLSWSSSATSIATVTQSGVVTGVAQGDSVITASQTIGGNNVQRTCTVHVLNNVAPHQGDENDPFTVDDAVNVAKGILTKVKSGASVDLENGTYYVKGQITKIQSGTISNFAFWIGDNSSQISAATGGFEVFKPSTIVGTAIATKYSTDNALKADFAVGYIVIASGKITLYNSTTPEFAAGGSVTYNNFIDATSYAEYFIKAGGAASATCAGTIANWTQMGTTFAAKKDETKALFAEATHLAPETYTNADEYTIKHAVARYDDALLKHTELRSNEFMGRFGEGKINGTFESNSSVITFGIDSNNNNMILTIVIVSLISLTALGCFFFIKKRKEQ